MTTVNKIEIEIPFPVGSVNIYFIQDSIPTLIDAAFDSDKSLEVVKLALRRIGYRLTDIKRILLTHGHLDHIGLAGRIAVISGAEIFIHPLDRYKAILDSEKGNTEKIEPFLRFFNEAGLPQAVCKNLSAHISEHFIKFFPRPFDAQHLSSHDTFSFDDFALETVYCPGHTPGSVCFFDRKNGRLFSGDHLLQNITPNPVVEIENQNMDNGYKSLSSYLRSLELISTMDVKLVLPGHGSPFSSHRKRVDEIKRHHRIRRQEVLKALKSYKGGLPSWPGASLFMISQQLFPNLRGWDIFLGLSEARGHLEILEEEELITSQKVDDQRFYYLGGSR